jgi:hypothetical protein
VCVNGYLHSQCTYWNVKTMRMQNHKYAHIYILVHRGVGVMYPFNMFGLAAWFVQVMFGLAAWFVQVQIECRLYLGLSLR